MRSPFFVFALGVSCLSGCAVSSAPDEAELSHHPSQPLTVENGANLNGANLNGANLNGNDLSGFLVSTSYYPVKKEGSVLDRVWLEGSTLRGIKGSSAYSGADFIGTELVGNLGDGKTVRLRITATSPAPTPNEDLSLYQVEFRGDDEQWYPICRDASGNALLALPVAGTWDYRQGVPGGGSKLEDPDRFTFACQGGAIAKCVQWGYRPWAHLNGVALAPYHQSCTRLVRADYCGDGKSYTQEGNRINLYDSLGIQRDTENWVFEAEWDEGGARCFYPLNRSHAGLPCYDSRVDTFCGQNLSPSRGVLLRNETPSGGLL
ncbi:MAG TPA: ADYC domain-containing protein [Archangium sp.]|nr:ADYC domain-containing protein [Archangium sp.]